MILGQAEEGGTDWVASILKAPIAASVIAVNAVIKLVSGGGDVPAAAEAELPSIPETPSDVTDVVGTGRSTARKPSASYGDDGSYASEDYAVEGASVWPWLLGVGLIAGGAYWFVRRRKHAKKGK